ncbi:hypothetical protein FIBSPDRAFT_1042182 [Athelia psychrophila]|uniref:Biotin carboxylase-like N-terminal domain-containing protein n=1 Tax=Athelia psychrophila TaxID=1759441 RepID=A0A166MWF6_9AGAM|nr:hypothetical protein FIBSPDRAFT_1042182 [Fibularhizoctonia sp. CBS 109695]
MLDDVSWFMSPERVDIVDIAKRTRGTHIHPGYGFLSERFALAYLFFSPTPGRLHVTPIGRAFDTTVFRLLEGRIGNLQRIRTWISGDDRGAGRQGGRGIIVVSAEEGVEQASKRFMLGREPVRLPACREKAPSGPGWKHVERSVQQRFQKAVEHLLFSATPASLDIALAFMPPHKAAPYNCASLPKTLPRTSLSAGAIAAQFHRGSRGAVCPLIRGFAVCPLHRKKRLLLAKIVVHGRIWSLREAMRSAVLALRETSMLQSTFSPSSLAFSLKQGQSSTGISAGAFDLADPNDSAHVAAALTGKTVGLHLAVWLSGVVAKGGYDRGVKRDEDEECGGRAGWWKGAHVGVVVRERMPLAVVALDGERSKSRL